MGSSSTYRPTGLRVCYHLTSLNLIVFQMNYSNFYQHLSDADIEEYFDVGFLC